MPLIKSASKSAIGPNILAEQDAGKPYKQALAIALHTQDRARQHRALGGGLSLSSPPPSFFERNEARELQNDQPHFGGLFKSDVAGRTDRLPHAVAADSFVVPADVVSGIGQGNTLAGAKIMDGILASGPYGTSLPRGRRADGGNAPGVSHVMVAGGEYLIPRDKLEGIGAKMRRAGKSRARTDLAAGHEWARDFVDRVRSKAKQFLNHAPKPKK